MVLLIIKFILFAAAHSPKVYTRNLDQNWGTEMSNKSAEEHRNYAETEVRKKIEYNEIRVDLRNVLLDAFAIAGLTDAYKITRNFTEVGVSPLQPFLRMWQYCSSCNANCLYCGELDALKTETEVRKMLDKSPVWKDQFEEYEQILLGLCEVEWLIKYHTTTSDNLFYYRQLAELNIGTQLLTRRRRG